MKRTKQKEVSGRKKEEETGGAQIIITYIWPEKEVREKKNVFVLVG